MKSLKHIYKAIECTDLNDIEIALKMLKELANGNYTPAMRRRLTSLENKKQKLCLTQ